jgi:hypothetical protein
VLPVADIHELSILFPLPPLRDANDFRVGATDLASSMLGDEGSGSVLSYLRASELGESLSAGLEVDSTGFSLLKVTVVLSPVVVRNAATASNSSASVSVLHEACDRISGAVFGYIKVNKLRATTTSSMLRRTSYFFAAGCTRRCRARDVGSSCGRQR